MAEEVFHTASYVEFRRAIASAEPREERRQFLWLSPHSTPDGQTSYWRTWKRYQTHKDHRVKWQHHLASESQFTESTFIQDIKYLGLETSNWVASPFITVRLTTKMWSEAQSDKTPYPVLRKLQAKARKVHALDITLYNRSSNTNQPAQKDETTMTGSGMSTSELVEGVLESMKQAAAGNRGAADALDAEDTTAPEETPRETDALVADKKKYPRPNGTEYFVRKIGIHDDVAVVRNARAKNINILATGVPGTGKTALFEASFCDDGFYMVQGHGDTETADFLGSYVPISATEFEWNDGPLLRAMEEGKPLYIDEIALIDPKVMAVVYGVMDGRGEIIVTQNPDRGTVVAKEGFYVLAACNPNAPGARMSEALLSRFALQFEVGTDYKLCKKMGVPAKVVTAAQNLASKVDAGEAGWAPQMRELLAYKEMESTFGTDFALQNLIAVAPEIERPTVMDVLSRAMGKSVRALVVS